MLSLLMFVFLQFADFDFVTYADELLILMVLFNLETRLSSLNNGRHVQKLKYLSR